MTRLKLGAIHAGTQWAASNQLPNGLNGLNGQRFRITASSVRPVTNYGVRPS